MPVAVAHENGAVRRERTARDECSGERRDRDRITVVRSTARHNAAHAYAAEAIRCAALGMAELPFCIRESGRWASLTLHVRLPSPHLVTGLRSTCVVVRTGFEAPGVRIRSQRRSIPPSSRHAPRARPRRSAPPAACWCYPVTRLTPTRVLALTGVLAHPRQRHLTMHVSRREHTSLRGRFLRR